MLVANRGWYQVQLWNCNSFGDGNCLNQKEDLEAIFSIFSSYTLVRIPSGSYTFGSYTFRWYTFHELPVAVDHLSGLRPVRDTQYVAHR